MNASDFVALRRVERVLERALLLVDDSKTKKRIRNMLTVLRAEMKQDIISKTTNKLETA
jgi:hypothetical protein